MREPSGRSHVWPPRTTEPESILDIDSGHAYIAEVGGHRRGIIRRPELLSSEAPAFVRPARGPTTRERVAGDYSPTVTVTFGTVC
jgi:hypothetical protein